MSQLVPLRIPSGWTVHHNSLVEPDDDPGEDLLWLQKTGYDLHLDLGWYQDHFKVVLMEGDWDNVRCQFDHSDRRVVLDEVERLLLEAT